MIRHIVAFRLKHAAGSAEEKAFLLHNSSNRNRFEDEIMQQFKVLQRPLRV